jgi:hypothetical protein
LQKISTPSLHFGLYFIAKICQQRNTNLLLAPETR